MHPKYAEYTLCICQEKQYWKVESFPGTQENKELPFLRDSMDLSGEVNIPSNLQPPEHTDT